MNCDVVGQERHHWSLPNVWEPPCIQAQPICSRLQGFRCMLISVFLMFWLLMTLVALFGKLKSLMLFCWCRPEIQTRMKKQCISHPSFPLCHMVCTFYSSYIQIIHNFNLYTEDDTPSRRQEKVDKRVCPTTCASRFICSRNRIIFAEQGANVAEPDARWATGGLQWPSNRDPRGAEYGCA